MCPSYQRCRRVGCCLSPCSWQNKGWRWWRRSEHSACWAGGSSCCLSCTLSDHHPCHSLLLCSKQHLDFVASSPMPCCCHTSARRWRWWEHRGLMGRRSMIMATLLLILLHVFRAKSANIGSTNKLLTAFWLKLWLWHKPHITYQSAFLQRLVQCCCSSRQRQWLPLGTCDRRATRAGSSRFDWCCRRARGRLSGRWQRSFDVQVSRPRSGKWFLFRRSKCGPRWQEYRVLKRRENRLIYKAGPQWPDISDWAQCRYETLNNNYTFICLS